MLDQEASSEANGSSCTLAALMRRLALIVVLVAGCGKTAGPPGASVDPRWRLSRALPAMANQVIPESDAAMAWGAPTAPPELTKAVEGALGLPGELALTPLRDTGRAFMVNGATVSLYARSWLVGDLGSVGLVSYALVDGKGRIDWAELFVQPAASRAPGDPLGSSLPAGLYDFLVTDQVTRGVRVFTADEYATTFLGGGPGSALTSCEFDESACSFGASLARDLIAKDACLAPALAAGITAGATCSFSVVGAIATVPCVTVAQTAVYFVCDYATQLAVDTVADAVCKTIVNCFPGSKCDECPFSKGVCGLAESAVSSVCTAINSYSVCGLAGILGKAHLPSFLGFLSKHGDDLVTVADNVCGTAAGTVPNESCVAAVGLTCERRDAGGVDVAPGQPPIDAPVMDAFTEDARGDADGGAGVGGDARPGGSVTGSTLTGSENHTCAIAADGTVWCWGRYPTGLLGNGTTPTRSSVPLMVPGVSDAVSIDGSCVVLTTGGVRCWNSYATTDFSGITTAKVVDVGAFHGCVLLSDETVRCWGENKRGQLGAGPEVSWSMVAKVPVPVKGLSGVKSISVSGEHACAVLGDGSVRCWGDNSFGQLGRCSPYSSSTCLGHSEGPNSLVGNSDVPIVVNGVSGAVSAFTAGQVGGAVLSDGTFVIWGIGSKGVAGEAPAPMEEVSGAVFIDLPCWKSASGTVTCLPTYFAPTGTTQPRMVEGLSGVTSLFVAFSHACAVAGGKVLCWGQNGADGLLGNGMTAGTIVPVAVPGLTAAR